MGLRIMRERLDRVEASLAVDSAPGRGTTVTVVWTRPDPEGSLQELGET
jgi:signal transduction histidine kinase